MDSDRYKTQKRLCPNSEADDFKGWRVHRESLNLDLLRKQDRLQRIHHSVIANSYNFLPVTTVDSGISIHIGLGQKHWAVYPETSR